MVVSKSQQLSQIPLITQVMGYRPIQGSGGGGGEGGVEILPVIHATESRIRPLYSHVYFTNPEVSV